MTFKAGLKWETAKLKGFFRAGGSRAQRQDVWFSPSCPGFDSWHPNFLNHDLFVAEIYLWSWIEKRRQKVDNAERTLLELEI